MRGQAVIRFLAVLLLLEAVMFTFAAEVVDPPMRPRKWPVVFGFEFTMEGIVTSVGLPNGTTVPIGVTPGSAAYRTEMARLYSICEETARTSQLPTVAQQYRSEGAPFRWVGQPHRWIGGPVTDLTDAVVEAKGAALNTLADRYALTDLDFNGTYHALAAAPSFIFTALKPFRAKHPLTIWERQTFDPEVYQDIDTQFTAKAWLSIMVVQFSQAVVEAGFPRCTIPWSLEPQWPYQPSYDDFEFIHPAATHAVCATPEIGKCSLVLGDRDEFHEFGLTPCSFPGRVAIVADLQNTSLSFWAEGLDGCQLDSVRWNTWPGLGPPTSDNVTAWSQAVNHKIAKLLEDTASRSNTQDGVKLIPTGEVWTPHLLESLAGISTTFTVHEISLPQFAASMNAAKVARYEEWSFHEFRVAGADTAEPFIRAQPKDEVPSFGPLWWVRSEDQLWRVGGDCLGDEECEDGCEWRGAAVCHPKEHMCMCAEIWEDEPGAGREDLYREIWEAERSERRDVIQKLSEEPQCSIGDRPVRASRAWDLVTCGGVS